MFDNLFRVASPRKIDVRLCRDKIRLVHSDLMLWPIDLPEVWRPKNIGTIIQSIPQNDFDDLKGYVGRVDAYFDRKFG